MFQKGTEASLYVLTRVYSPGKITVGYKKSTVYTEKKNRPMGWTRIISQRFFFSLFDPLANE